MVLTETSESFFRSLPGRAAQTARLAEELGFATLIFLEATGPSATASLSR
jgi:hypothetical protein